MKIRKKAVMHIDEAYSKVLFWFFSYPQTEISMNNLSSKLEISKTTASRVVKELVEEGFLFNKTYGKTWSITCNPHHYYNFTRKISYNIEGIYELFENGLREKIHQIVRNPRCIVLFGSYRKGDNNETSDIDIAVEVIGDEETKIIDLGKAEAGFRKDITVNLHVFSRKKVDINLFANIVNGFVLEGFLEARP